MHMPVVDGPEFAQVLSERGIHVPLVVMTAGTNARRWAERLGASAHLAKPFAVDQLLEVTRRVTGGGSPALN
jgi:CheY-like chemotaxis protein